REFENWTDLNCIVFHGNQESREMIVEHEFEFPGRSDCLKFNVMITTWEVVMADERDKLLANIPWDVVIVDEAHRLKNADSKTFKSLQAFNAVPTGEGRADEAHIILLTGTPIQNNTEELWCLLHFLSPLGFADKEAFLTRFGTIHTASQVAGLKKQLAPLMLRRQKENVEKSIPPKEEIIVEVEMSQLQRTTYKSILEKNFDWLTKGAKGSQAPALRNVEMELRKCCNHPYLIDGVQEQVRCALNSSCLTHSSRLSSKSPPTPRPALTPSPLNHTAPHHVVLLDKILPKLRSEDHRVLIFSQFIKVLDMLETYLRAKSYPNERIDGRIRGNLRQTAFCAILRVGHAMFAFLICTKAGGMGINLTTADTVIIFDSEWEPPEQPPAKPRCHRIGQTRNVKIYRFITVKTYERRMFERASQKQGLEQAVIHQKVSEGEADKKELERLLRHGAYDLFQNDSEQESKKFNEEDIEEILQRRSTKVQNPKTFPKT
ncbi:P-loop containing nucleoside triphosphate hydrolase protein, partial [Baffinella frigidus]